MNTIVKIFSEAALIIIIIAAIGIAFIGWDIAESSYEKSFLKEKGAELLAEKGWETLEADIEETHDGYEGNFLIRGGFMSRTTSVKIKFKEVEEDFGKAWEMKTEVPKL